MAIGAKKYGRKNWRKQPINASTYYSGIMRHLLAWWEGGEDLDIETTKHHLCSVIANALIILDGIDAGTLMDDRAFAEALHTEG